MELKSSKVTPRPIAVDVGEPTEEALRAAFVAFYRTPIYDELDIESPPPDENWWPQFRECMLRALKCDRERVARGEQ
jgi:hypothetical protein